MSRLPDDPKPVNAGPINAGPINAEPVNAEPINASSAEAVGAAMPVANTGVAASLLRWFSIPALAGVVVGLLWWLLAPGGAFYGEGTDTLTWFPRDAVLAGLALLAGLLTAVFLLPQRGARDAWRKLVATLLGCVLGAVVAWQIGTLAGVLWGSEADGVSNESVAFSLRSYTALLLWPLGCALMFFVVTLGSTLRSPADRQD